MDDAVTGGPARGRGRGGAGRPRAGHLHVRIERRSEGRGAHARHRRAHTTALTALQTADGTSARFFCVFPFFWIGGTLIRAARCRPGDRARHRALRPRRRARPHRGRGGHARARMAHAAASDAGPSVVPRAAPPDHSRPDRRPRRPRAGRRPVPGIPAHRGMSETVGNIASVGYRVVDPDTGVDVPDGEEGELWVRGYGLMHGYYKQERADVFDSDGWFHTGDRVSCRGARVVRGSHDRDGESTRRQRRAARGRAVPRRRVRRGVYAFVLGMPHPEFGEQVAAVLVPAYGRTSTPTTSAGRTRADLSTRCRRASRCGTRPTCRGWGQANPTSAQSANGSRTALSKELDG